jgi:glycosyltransferase involved in cell wall biosynthesis
VPKARIGLNCLFLRETPLGGIEVYARQLLRELGRYSEEFDFVVLVSKQGHARVTDWCLPGRVEVTPLDSVPRSARYLSDLYRISKVATELRCDLVHSLAYMGPLCGGFRKVVTIHDANCRSKQVAMPIWRSMPLFLATSFSGLTADAVITISDFSRREVTDRLFVNASKVHAIYLGRGSASDDEVVRARYGSGDTKNGECPLNLVAFAGGDNEHKNLARLLDAIALAAKDIPVRLHLLGNVPVRLLSHPVLRNGTAKSYGFISDTQVQDVFKHAQAFMMASTYEGFGMPLLEAQAQGVPVLCSRIPVFEEMIAQSAIMFDPFSVTDIRNAIVQFAKNEHARQALQEAGLLNVARFSWSRNAQQTVTCYRSLLT